MEYEEYESIKNDSLIDYEKDIKIGKNFIPPKVEQNLDKMVKYHMDINSTQLSLI